MIYVWLILGILLAGEPFNIAGSLLSLEKVVKICSLLNSMKEIDRQLQEQKIFCSGVFIRVLKIGFGDQLDGIIEQVSQKNN